MRRTATTPAKVPPRWFVRSAWAVHRGIHRLTRGRLGLWRPKPHRWGTLRLTTTGCRSGLQRSVIVAYFCDGPNLVTMAMNGWADSDPAWWRNLQADPDAVVEVADGTLPVRARAASGEERERLWARWREFGDDVDALAALRSGETAVVVLQPHDPQHS